MKKLMLLTLAILVATALFPMTAAFADGPSDETAFVVGINNLRAGKGLPALAVHSNLTSKARAWAQTMADKGTIWHSVLSDGITADWQKLGENVGRGGSVAALEQAFVNSPAHYDNLIDPTFDTIGVGVVRGAGDIIFVAEEFMQLRRSVAAAATPIAQTPVAAIPAAVAPVALKTPVAPKAPVAVKAPIAVKAPVAVKTPVATPVTAPIMTPVTAPMAVEAPLAVEAAEPLGERTPAPAAVSVPAHRIASTSGLMAACKSMHCSNIVQLWSLFVGLFFLITIRNSRRSLELVGTATTEAI
jgi:hypothetical protein